MSLILGIETSSDRYSVILADDERILYDSSEDCAVQAAQAEQATQAGSLDKDTARNLPFLVRFGLEGIVRTVADIDSIAVDIGPGNLGSVRTGVAFANGLAFSLGKSVWPITAFELLGLEAAARCHLPILCIRKASAGNVFAGLYDGRSVTAVRFGLLLPTITALAGIAAQHRSDGKFALAGAWRAESAALLPDAKITDSGIEVPQARTMMRIGIERRAQLMTKQVSPLNEQSRIFHE